MFDHFEKVVNRCNDNRMSAQNMAIVFGPTLFADPPSGYPPSYETPMRHNNIVQKIIDNYSKLKPLFE